MLTIRGGEKSRKKTYYNRGFKHTEDLVGLVIFQARKFGFMEGWMAAVNAIGLPKNSPFKKADQVLVPEDPAIEVQNEEQKEDNSDDRGGDNNPESQELSRKIDTHIMVLNDEQPRTKVMVSE